jgi:hypothetical protein
VSDLTTFLHARLDGDEESWRGWLSDDEPGPWAQLLADVEAKRELLGINDDVCHPSADYVQGWEDAGNYLLRVLATVYADHPDYDGAWKL